MSAFRNMEEAALREVMVRGQKARDELQRREEVALTKEKAGLVGKCFKYQNSFGSGEKWWLYRRVLSVTGRYGTAFDFQTMADGRIEIHNDRSAIIDAQSWIEITEREYTAAWKRLMVKLRSGYRRRKK